MRLNILFFDNYIEKSTISCYCAIQSIETINEDFHMMIKRSLLSLFLTFALISPALAGIDDEIEREGQYWQRISVSSAIYTVGPKAQQMLNRDIARCVVELRELERLGAVIEPIPTYASENVVLSDDEARMIGFETPERDKELFREHSDYIDFEGCMISKGWQRVKYVPFKVAAQAKENYKKTHVAYREEARQMGLKFDTVDNDFDNLNE